jgi:hypothetical protein
VYVLDEQEQERLLPELDLVAVEDEGWTKRLLNPSTGEQWTLYYPSSGEHGGGLRFLRLEPAPNDPVEWALRCVGSTHVDDAIGAAFDLSKQPEAWEAIITRFEEERGRLPEETW